MTKITIDIPDNKVQGVIDAFALAYGYQGKIQDGNGNEIDNPVTKAQFARNIINSFIKEVYVSAQVKGLDAQRQQTIVAASADVAGINTT